MITRSESLVEITKALLAVHAEIEPMQPDGTNPAFRHGYVTLTNIIEATRPLLLKNGLTYTQHPGFRDGVITMETLLLHTSGEWMLSEAGAPMEKATAQGVGSAVTYLRRYSLASILGLGQEDDDGQAASQRGRRQERRDTRQEPRHDTSPPQPREPQGWEFTNTKLAAELKARNVGLQDVKRVYNLAGDDAAGIAENIRIMLRRSGGALEAMLDRVASSKLPEGDASA